MLRVLCGLRLCLVMAAFPMLMLPGAVLCQATKQQCGVLDQVVQHGACVAQRTWDQGTSALILIYGLDGSLSLTTPAQRPGGIKSTPTTWKGSKPSMHGLPEQVWTVHVGGHPPNMSKAAKRSS